ncbi:MAG: FAD-binding oxidoreductase [Burkholderiales bacterium]|nr:FAD-binding oxidoreductase [Burkholderiales bacterium]
MGDKLNYRRRNFLQLAAAAGGGYVLGRFLPESNDTKYMEKVIANSTNNSQNRTFYSTNQLYNPKYPKLEQDGEYDVCIVGGGLTGISTAQHLANSGLKVILLEQSTLASHASGMSGGQILSSYDCGIDFFEDKFGRDIAKRFWDLSLDAINLVKNNIRAYNINCGWQMGTSVAAFKHEDVEDIKADYEIMTKGYGYKDVQLFNAKEAKILTGSDIYHGLLYDTGTGHLNPLNYTLGLGSILKNFTNIHVFENSPVSSIEFNDPLHTIMVADKFKIKAKKIVLGANYGNDKFLPDLASLALTMDTFIMATESLSDELLKKILPNRMAVYDTRNIMNYYRLTEKNNLIFGGGDSFGQYELKDIMDGLYRELINTFPMLAGIDIDEFWFGKDSVTINFAPLIGKTYNSTVYYAKGYSGQGMALSNLVGKLAAQAINGNSADYDLFSKIEPVKFTSSKYLQDLAIKTAIEYDKFRDKYL